MKRFKNILCVVDIDTPGEKALGRAVTLAKNNQASLTVISVGEHIEPDIHLPKGAPSPIDLQKAINQKHLQMLDALVDPFMDQVRIKTKILTGIPFLQIIREVLRHDHDLVIKTPGTHSWLQRLFGSNDMHLLRKCPCPVWFIKSEALNLWRRILLAIDIDDHCPPEELTARQALNRQIFEMGSSLALSDIAELHIVYAWEAVGEGMMRGAFMRTSKTEINAYVREVKKSEEHRLSCFLDEMTGNDAKNTIQYLNPQIHMVKGSAKEAIPAQAKKIKADLIVMGTVARTGIPGFIMGNTAEEILNSIDCSVLAIKPPEFISPVTLEG